MREMLGDVASNPRRNPAKEVLEPSSLAQSTVDEMRAFPSPSIGQRPTRNTRNNGSAAIYLGATKLQERKILFR